MKNLNRSNYPVTQRSVPIVFFSLLVLGMMVPVVAQSHCVGKHSGNHPHCNDGGGSGGGGTGGTLAAEFCLVMLDVEDGYPGLESDGDMIVGTFL